MKSNITKLSAAAMLLAVCPLLAQEGEKPDSKQVDLKPEEVKTETSFGLGYQGGRRAIAEMQQNGLQAEAIDIDAYVAGIRDGLTETELTPEKINRIESAFKLLGERLMAEQEAAAKANEAAARKFLEENKKAEGIVTTDSGLQYSILKKGEGEVFQESEQKPNVRFMVHYKGTFIDGTEFDSSPNYDKKEDRRAVPFNLNVVPGFREALLMMPVGSKWKIVLPPNLGYGAEGIPGSIPANSVLIFEVELESIKDIPMPAPLPEDAGE